MRAGRAITVVEEPISKPIAFSPSVAEVKRVAATKKQVYLLYFCSQEEADTAGGDEAAHAQFRAAHNGLRAEWTVFDCPQMVGPLKDHDLAGVAKVIKGPQTEALFKQYGVVGTNTLVLCAPSGDKLVTAPATSRAVVTDILKNLKTYMLEWEKMQAAKAGGATIKK